MFATTTPSSRVRADRDAQAMCGVMTQFFALSTGLSAFGGSVDNTSKPAPAILPRVERVGEIRLVDHRPPTRVEHVGTGFLH